MKLRGMEEANIPGELNQPLVCTRIKKLNCSERKLRMEQNI